MAEAEKPSGQRGPTVVSLPEEIDVVSGPAAAAKLSEAISTGATIIIADLTHTTLVDSSGARLLYLAYGEAAATGAQLRLATSRPAVLRVLELMGFDQVLPIFPTAAQALTAPPAA